MNRIYLIILAVFFTVGCSDNKFAKKMDEKVIEALEDCGLPITEPIIFFTSSGCPGCARLKNLLESNDIEYYEMDVEEHHQEFICLGGSYIPHLIVEGKKVNYGNSEELDLALRPYSDLL